MSTASEQAPAAQGSLERGATKLCECGCGTAVRPGSRFARGHHRRIGREATLERVARFYRADPIPTLAVGAQELGLSQSAISNYLRELGIELPPNGSRLMKYPDPGVRTCDRDECENLFRPKPSTVANGRGRYCSYRCRDLAATHRPRQKGEWITCPVCGGARWWYASDVARGRTFCSPSCWGRHRWKHGLIATWWLARPLSGSARRTWKLRWTRSPGRARSYTDKQAAWVLTLAAQGYGHARIAETTGLSRDTVRRIRGREKHS
jgi:Helix-turn-helix domain of resolvase